MRWLLSFLLLGLLSVVQALSSSGNKLLVLLDDAAEKSKYSKYIADLEGMDNLAQNWLHRILILCLIIGRGFSLTFETPKSDKVALFELGERAYDHVLLLPTKVKGRLQWKE